MDGQGSPLILARGRTHWVRAECFPVCAQSACQWVVVALSALLLADVQSFAQNVPAESTAPEAVRFATNRNELIFAPGEQFEIAATLTLPDSVAGRVVVYKFTLRSVEDGRTVWSQEDTLDVPIDGQVSVSAPITVPHEDGVYALQFSALPPRAFDGFNLVRRPPPIASREFQIIVFGSEALPIATGPVQWAQVGLIEPNNPRWWQRLPQWTMVHRLPGLTRRGPSGSSPPLIVKRGSGQFIELPPKNDKGESHWQAFALPIRELGLPHLVEIQYPADAELQLGFSILQSDTPPNNASQLESGVFIDRHLTDAAGQIHQHRLVYWPTTKSPVLLVTNGHPDLPAYFGTIRVLAGPARLAEASVPRPQAAPIPERLVATFVEPTSIPTVFGVPGLTADGEQLSFPDWQTAQLVARRLSEYSHYAGYNAAVLPWDAFHHEVTGQSVVSDLPPIDPLELVLRTFARERLTLLPEVKLDGTAGDRSQAMLARYGGHAALGGLVVHVSSRGLAELVGTEPLPDENQIMAFEQETGVRVSPGVETTLTERRAVLLENYRHEWRQWRADRVAAELRSLAESVREKDARRRVIVSIDPLLSEPELRKRLRPALLENTELPPLLLEFGIDIEQLAQIPGLVVLEPQVIAPAAPLVDRAIDLQINEVATVLGRVCQGASSGALTLHRGRPGRLAAVGSDLPLQAQGDSLPLLTVPVADGAAARQSWLHALADQDRRVIIEAGPAPAIGQDELVAAHRETFRWLPEGVPAESVPAAQPVVVRTFHRPDDSTVCVINDSPWPVLARVTLKLPQACTMQIGPGPQSPLDQHRAAQSFNAGNHSLSIELDRYDLVAARFTTADVTVDNVEVKTDPQVHEQLAARIDELNRRDKRSAEACLYPVLANPSFEVLGGETQAQPVAGWQVLIPGPTGSVRLSDAQSLIGKSCLVMEASEHPVGIQSQRFRTPPTGQLALGVHIRAENTSPDSQLRIVFESVGEPEYLRFARLTSVEPADRPLGKEGGTYLFGMQDLPLHSTSDMVLRFELLGPGQVWIDDVKLHSLLFPLPHPDRSSEQQRFALTKVVRAAHNALEHGNVTDCQQLLDGYWPQFMNEYLPMADPDVPLEEPQVAEPEMPHLEEATPDREPSLSERVRRFFWR